MFSLGNNHWFLKDLAHSLYISTSEVTESLIRSKIAGLIDNTKRKIFKNSFFEFLIYGLKYVFPAQPGAIVRGIATAHSAKPLSDLIISEKDIYVWQTPDGELRGQSIEPLYKTVPKAVEKDNKLYEMLALIDAIRVGRSREYNIAVKELSKRIKNIFSIISNPC